MIVLVTAIADISICVFGGGGRRVWSAEAVVFLCWPVSTFFFFFFFFLMPL